VLSDEPGGKEPHPSEKALREVATLEGELDKGGMLGEHGPKIYSKTLWEGDDGYERIDVENPSPGKRPGQIHYQPAPGQKWYYDPANNDFYDQKTRQRAPKSVNDKLSNPEFTPALRNFYAA
jgi:filamentous hemagglutinin